MRTKSKKENKINVVTLGCSKNVYDSEVLMGQLKANGKNVVHEDKNDNGLNDFLELAKHDLDTDIKKRKQDLDERKFQEKSKNDIEKLKIEKRKLAQNGNSK